MAVTHPESSPASPRTRLDVGEQLPWEQARGRDNQRTGEQQRSEDGSGRGGRSLAEWVTFGISASIVLALVALVTYFHLTTPATPAAIEVETRLDETYQSGSRYYLPITVRNTGGSTGEDVRVRATLTDGGARSESSEVLIPFLAGGGSNRAVVAFGGDPRQGQISAVVVSYLEP